MAESLIIYSKHNVYTLHLPRNKKQYIHGFLQCLGAILITVGISFKISKQSPPHFQSTHSILGEYFFFQLPACQKSLELLCDINVKEIVYHRTFFFSIR